MKSDIADPKQQTLTKTTTKAFAQMYLPSYFNVHEQKTQDTTMLLVEIVGSQFDGLK